MGVRDKIERRAKVKRMREMVEAKRAEMFPPFNWRLLVIAYRDGQWEQIDVKPVFDYTDDEAISKDLVDWELCSVKKAPERFEPSWDLSAKPKLLDTMGLSNDLQDKIREALVDNGYDWVQVYG